MDPKLLTIQEFKTIWEADTDKRKDNAVKEVSFVYFMCDVQSPYVGYPEVTRMARVKQDIFKDANMTLDTRVLKAMVKYEELKISASPTLSMLKSAQRAIAKIEQFFNSVDVSDDKSGAKMATLLKTLGSLDGVVKGLAALEQKVTIETETMGRVKGGGFIGARELPRERRTNTTTNANAKG